jgi:hypothetical protein
MFVLVQQFVEKDPKLAEPVLLQLLKFWPLTNSQKEVLFLGELEEILELTQPQEFQRVLVPLFKQLAKCLTSAHFQVRDPLVCYATSRLLLSCGAGVAALKDVEAEGLDRVILELPRQHPTSRSGDPQRQVSSCHISTGHVHYEVHGSVCY